MPCRSQKLLLGNDFLRDGARLADYVKGNAAGLELAVVVCRAAEPGCALAPIESLAAEALQRQGLAVESMVEATMSFATLLLWRETWAAGDGNFVARAVTLVGLNQDSQVATMHELETLRALATHPNLTDYHLSFCDDVSGLLCAVTPVLSEDNESLRAVLAEARAVGDPPDGPSTIDWASQMLAGVGYLHDHGLLHRDLRPSNVVLLQGRRVVRLGECALLPMLAMKLQECVTLSGHEVDYLAPELMRNEPYSVQSDLWALGCIFFELCALRPPFQGGSVLELALRVMDDEPDWSLCGDALSSLSMVMNGLLSKDIDERPSADACLEELQLEGGHDLTPPLARVEAWSEPATPTTAADSLTPPLSSRWAPTPKALWQKHSLHPVDAPPKEATLQSPGAVRADMQGLCAQFFSEVLPEETVV
jgi:serine/threonine protein kinase